MFKVLGIQFCNNLTNMQCNYEKGIQNIRDISNNWKFRYLTIFGKMTVMKMFMLPQLTHLATVIPSLTARQVEEIHKIWEDFICEDSPNVVDIKMCYTPVRDDGLGLHKVADFWGAVKTSWLRRLPYTISLQQVNQILNNDYTLREASFMPEGKHPLEMEKML